jgi:hypothetical protein
LAPNRKKCAHGNYVCELCVKASDAAKRFSDGVNALLAFTQPWEARNKWVVIGLQDGSVDSTLYDTREDAMAHQHGNEARFFYMPLGNFLQGLKLIDAECILMFQRDAYDAGLRVTDSPDKGNADPFLSVFKGDVYHDLLRKGLRNNG